MNPRRRLVPLLKTALLGALVSIAAGGCSADWLGDLTRRVFEPRRWYVATTGDDHNDCRSVDTPCRTIGAAILRAGAADSIYVGVGTYREYSTHEDGGFIIDKGISLIGTGSDPDGVHLEGERGTGPVIVIRGHHVRPTIQNLTVQNALNPIGSGVKVIDAGPHLQNVVLRDNEGAGIDYWSSDPLAILTLTDVLITGNGGGGATLGGLGSTEMDGVQITGNTGSPGITVGTLAFGVGASLTARRITIDGNRADYVSGLWVGEGSTVQIINSTVSGDDPTAIFNDGTLALVNTTVSGNAVAIRNWRDLSLIHSTVAHNRLLSLDGRDATRLHVVNSILLREAANDCSDSASMDLSVEGHNLFCWPDDPLLGPLADNGGPTQTIALLPGSPAIDAAAPIASSGDYAAIVATDQRGVPRPFGSASDIGAYEFQFTTVAATGVPPPQTVTPSILTVQPPALPIGAPTFTFQTNGNCRQGPGTAYPVVTSFYAGDEVQIQGRNDDASWFWLFVPNSKSLCAASAATGVTSGPLSDLRYIPAPALPATTVAPPPVEPPTLVPPPVAPAAPGKLTVSTKSCNSSEYIVTLQWNDVDGENGYRVYRDGKLIDSLPANSTSYDDVSPNFNPHAYQVEAFNKVGSSASPAKNSSGCVY